MTFLRRLGQFLLVALIPALAGLWIAGNSQIPFATHTADLWVYREAASYLLQGRDFYALEDAFPYIYPPIAAVLGIPLALIPWPVAQVLWNLVNVAVIVAVLRHLRVGPPWLVSFLATVTILFVHPVSETLIMGQLGIVLLGLVLLDSTDGPRLFRGENRLLPAGVLTGIATGLKLTPAVFIVHYFLTKRYRQGFIALGTFVGTVLVGFIAAPRFAAGYWARLAGGNSGANPDAHGWINNISVMSAVYRFTDVTTLGTVLGLLLSALLVAAGLAAAWLSWRARKELLGISILGMVSCVANPIAWAHHLTWVIPLLVAGLRSRISAPLRLSVLFGALWSMVNPQAALPGAPWAWTEIHEYTVAEKLLAAGPDIVVMLMVVLALATLRPPGASAVRRTEGADEPEPVSGDPEHAVTDRETKA